MMTRSQTLITMSIAIVAHAFSLCMKPVRLLWNASESVPVGLYSVEAGDQLAVTNLVVAMPPNSLATFLDERGYVPLGVPLIKRILALVASQCAEASSSSASTEYRWARRSRMIGKVAHCQSGRAVERLPKTKCSS